MHRVVIVLINVVILMFVVVRFFNDMVDDVMMGVLIDVMDNVVVLLMMVWVHGMV